MGPLRVASVSTHALPAADCALTFYPCHFIPGRVASNLESAAHWWQLRSASRPTAPLGAVSFYMSSESEDFPPPLTPTAPNGAAEPARGTPLWSPGDDESEDHPLLSTPSALNGLTTPASGTPLWSPGDDESEEFTPPPPPPPPPAQTAPQESTRTFTRNPDSTPPCWQYPHPCQWQVLYRSYSRKQCRACKRRPLPSAVSQSVLRLVCNWLHTRSPLATMNPHRPGGGPRQHYRMAHGAGLLVSWQRGQRGPLPVLQPLLLMQMEVAPRNLLALLRPRTALLPGPLCQPRFRYPRPPLGSRPPLPQPPLQPQLRLLLQPRDLHTVPTPVECSTRPPA